jgi:hypothetical protein
LDAGALIALDRAIVESSCCSLGRPRSARRSGSATALAQAIRQPARQARLAKLVRQPTTDVAPLDGPDATSVGVLLAASRTTDIADAHVVICARRARQAIVTSDPADLRRLDPTARLVVV